MNNILISVVIPVFNVENFLNECVNSVLNQDYKNFEIILVDDGSTDSSPKICDSFAKSDNRIKVIHKENEGLGMARNTGIENACGDYVYFLDSDDYIDKNTFIKCINYIKKFKPNIIFFGHRKFNNDKILETCRSKYNKIYVGNEIEKDLLPELISPSKGNGIYMSACMGMFDLNLIKSNEWKFVSERTIISEDVYSLLNLVSFCNSILIVDDVFYNYRVNVQSLTHVYRKDRIEKIIEFYYLCVDFCNNHFTNDELLNRFSLVFGSFLIGGMKTIVKTDSLSYLKKLELLSNISNNNDVRKIINVNLKYNNNIKEKVFFYFIILKFNFINYLILKYK